MSTNQKLRKLADRLPNYPKTDANGIVSTVKQKAIVKGSELLENGETQRLDKDGLMHDINPHHSYETIKRIPLMSNHFEELKKAFRMNKTKGVVDYITKVYAFNKKELPAGLSEIINE